MKKNKTSEKEEVKEKEKLSGSESIYSNDIIKKYPNLVKGSFFHKKILMQIEADKNRKLKDE